MSMHELLLIEMIRCKNEDRQTPILQLQDDQGLVLGTGYNFDRQYS